MGFGWQELLIILAIVLVVFGGSKVPGVFRSMGEGIREFRDATSDDGDEADSTSGDSSAGDATPQAGSETSTS